MSYLDFMFYVGCLAMISIMTLLGACLIYPACVWCSCVQVERYAKVFWEKGSMAFAPADWERHVKNVEKGERKIEEINR